MSSYAVAMTCWVVCLALVVLGLVSRLPAKLHCDEAVYAEFDPLGRVIAPDLRCEGRVVQDSDVPLWRCDCGRVP